MRLVELGLTRFGGFTDARLDLSAPGLHVIHGRNEAGKSTALRAIRALFYGIPHITSDAYLHDELLLFARVVGADGSELAFQRRKGRKNTLLAPDGSPLEERVLSRLLGGVNQALFETTFGLDHERLRRGGAEIAAGGSDVGHTLFDAGIGAGSVKRLLDELRREADELYSPRTQARTKLINAALREHKERVELVRTASTRPQAWADQKKELVAAQAALGDVEARRSEHKRRLAAAEELVKVLPLVARRDAARAKLELVGGAPPLPQDAAERRIGAERDLAATERDLERTALELAGVERELAELRVPEALALLDDRRLDALRERLGKYRDARVDSAKRQAELAAAKASLARGLAALGRDDTEPRALVVHRADLARVGSLAVERAGLEAARAQAEARLGEARAALAALEAEVGLEPWRAADPGVPADALDRALPSLERVDAFARRFANGDQAREKLEATRSALERERATAETELAEIALAGEVPTEAELLRVRQERDARLLELRSSRASESRVALEQLAGIEELVRRADEVSDRLRREATRVARFAALEARRRSAAAALEGSSASEAVLASEAAALAADWTQLWREVALEPLAPAEMRARLERLLRAREKRAELHTAAARARTLVASADAALAEAGRRLVAWGERWAEAVRAMGLGPGATPAEATEVGAALAELATTATVAEELRHRIRGMEQASTAFEAEVAEIARRHLPELVEAAAREVEWAASEIFRRHRACRELERQVSELEARRARAIARSDELGARRESALAELALLMQVAGVTDRAQLPDAEARAATRAQAETEIAALERDLAALTGSADLDALGARARGVALAEARARVAELDEELAQLDAEHAAARDRCGAAERGLARYDDSETAADAQVEAETWLAKVRAAAERWARLQLGWRILRDEVERYRASHQAPLLARANELFPRLTLGEHSALVVDHDADPPVLCAVARGGARVAVEQLSDGARDQLYLALRLASLEHYARASEALPVCLDDVLVHFDEPRTRATLALLGEVASQLQVLLFTHHEHVVTEAVKVVPASALSVHELRRGEPPRRRERSELGG